jgi:hypothetical protein
VDEDDRDAPDEQFASECAAQSSPTKQTAMDADESAAVSPTASTEVSAGETAYTHQQHAARLS